MQAGDLGKTLGLQERIFERNLQDTTYTADLQHCSFWYILKINFTALLRHSVRYLGILIRNCLAS